MSTRMIVLAAGRGTRLAPLTDDRPKALVPLAGRSLLDWQTAAARRCGVAEVVVLGGFHAERLSGDVVLNPDFETTNMAWSLMCARHRFGQGFILSYGDIAYRPEVLRALIDSPAEVSVVVDRDWRDYWERRFADPLADAESLRLDGDGRILEIGRKERDIERIQAQYVGLVAFRGPGVEALERAWDRFPDDRRRELFMTDLLQCMLDAGVTLRAVPIHGGWVEIDSLADLALAERLVQEGRLAGA